MYFRLQKLLLDKKRIQAIFLLEFKTGHKATETTHNINNTFGQGTANEQCSSGSRSFAKEMSLEDKEHSGQPLKVDHNQLRAIIKADPLTTTQEVSQELNVDHSMVIWHLKQTGKVKKLNKWVPS